MVKESYVVLTVFGNVELDFTLSFCIKFEDECLYRVYVTSSVFYCTIKWVVTETGWCDTGVTVARLKAVEFSTFHK